MTVRILRRAEKDLAAIHRHIARQSPRTADAVVERLLLAIEGLGDSPGAGARPRDERLRALGFRWVTSDGFLVFYKVVGKVVRIYRVLRGKRAYERIL